ncbi:MAG: family 16 glycosylhydrolase [Saprospiraceae bacterium]|nr:family 16 glycosylhydrolase [Saprospiraceae bacterium]
MLKWGLIISSLIILIVACTKTKDTGPAAYVPKVGIQDVQSERSEQKTNLKFFVYIDKITTVPVSVDYSLTYGTALANKDYTNKTGTVTIPIGETFATFDAELLGDVEKLRQPNLYFNVKLSNPKDCTIDIADAKGIILTENAPNIKTDNTGYTTPNSYSGYNLVWSDEFNGNALDLNTWNQELGNGSGGWGNNELEYYTNKPTNTFVSNGNLIIEARKEYVNGFGYTSGRMTTQNKKTFKYGRIDIRAKLPVGQGIWPALWMLGSNISSIGWPACGEIDIMELVGSHPSTTYGTAHWKQATGGTKSFGSEYNLASGDFSSKFHVFSLIWQEDSMKWYVDDEYFCTVSKATVGTANYPFNDNFFFIFNVAVGGKWPGTPPSTTVFPQRMFVDYVRVFQ